jgi:hypothetical protein
MASSSSSPSRRNGKWLVIALIAIGTLAALIGIWKRGLRPVSPDAASTRRTS